MNDVDAKVKRRNLKTLINLAYRCFLFREVDSNSLKNILSDMENDVYGIDSLIEGLLQSEEYMLRESNLASPSDASTSNENIHVKRVLGILEQL